MFDGGGAPSLRRYLLSLHTVSTAMAISSYTLESLAQQLDAELQGDPALLISGLATLQDAKQGQLAFLANPVYKKYLTTTAASAVIISRRDCADFAGNALVVDNPYACYARLTALFTQQSAQPVGIHPSAVVADTASIAADVVIGPHVVIEEDAVVGEGCRLGAGVFLGRGSSLGANTVVHSHVSIYHGCVIGARCVLHSGVVIGGDGFGFAPDAGDWVKIHHLAGVQIGDEVELGANTCVDRGALTDTIIEHGVKLDNMVQIAHGVKVGHHTVIAGCAGVAGSTEIGANCIIAGGVGIVGHIKIADRCTITAMTLVTKSITESGSYSSGTPMLPSKAWRRGAARMAQLEEIYQRLKKLENME